MICIVGPRKLQNELIASRLETEIGVKCWLGEDIGPISLSNDRKYGTERNGSGTKLVLWDCHGKDLNSILHELEYYGNKKSSGHHVALFNVSHDMGIEEQCVWLGVRGFFYDHDSLPQFLQGVRVILSGELWLSRKIMTKCILGNKDLDNTVKTYGSLTKRESEILAHLAVGATNQEISDKLCISPHTVKTHLYNIYKKINVPNRLQAALWAAKNL